jgi:hypothetical protein
MSFAFDNCHRRNAPPISTDCINHRNPFWIAWLYSVWFTTPTGGGYYPCCSTSDTHRNPAIVNGYPRSYIDSNQFKRTSSSKSVILWPFASKLTRAPRRFIQSCKVDRGTSYRSAARFMLENWPFEGQRPAVMIRPSR